MRFVPPLIARTREEEKRNRQGRLIKIVDKNLPREEKRAWYKNIKMNETGEILTRELINFYTRMDRS
jgi:hypothetical protein